MPLSISLTTRISMCLFPYRKMGATKIPFQTSNKNAIRDARHELECRIIKYPISQKESLKRIETIG